MALRENLLPWLSQPQDVVRPAEGWGFDGTNGVLFLPQQATVFGGDGFCEPYVEGIAAVPALSNGRSGFVGIDFPAIPITGNFTFLIYAAGEYALAGVPTSPSHSVEKTGAILLNEFVVTTTSARFLLDNNAATVMTGDWSRPALFIATRVGNQTRSYARGEFRGTAVTGTRTGAFTGLNYGRSRTAANPGRTSGYLMGVRNGALTDAEIARLGDEPWQLFEHRSIWVPVSAAAAPVELGGAAAAVASASGQLSTQIRIRGVGAAVSMASGALATAVRLGGAASADAASTGALSTAIKLAGGAPAVASAAGALSTSIRLSGAAQALANAAGAIIMDSGLSGAAVAAATATGALTTEIRLAGAAFSTASAAGVLAAPGAGLAGSAKAGATATGALETGIRLGGNTSAAVAAAGQLLTSIRLAASATCEAMAAGALSSTGDALQGATVAQCIAAGRLTTQILLAARATGSAIATGRLAGDEAGRSYPLAGRTQVFPLVGQQQTYPLAGATQE